MVLFQMPISHFCEKARWALDLKGVTHTRVDLVPVQHLPTAYRLSGDTKLPLLRSGGQVIAGSGAILDHLHNHGPSLHADTRQEQEQVMEWEQWADRELGPHIRRFCYATLLHHPDLVVPMFMPNGSDRGRRTLRVCFPVVAALMRRTMRIDEAGAERSRVRLEAALDRLREAYRDKPYLVAGRFTRADLTVAALLAPLTMPTAYGVPWPELVPDPLGTWTAGQPLDFVVRLYRDHRSPA